MIPIQKVKDIILRHKRLENELSSGEIDKKKYATLSKEYSDIKEIINSAMEFENFENDKKELDIIIDDKQSDQEIKELAKQELKTLIENSMQYLTFLQVLVI